MRPASRRRLGRSVHWQPDSGQFLLNFDTKQIVKPARLKVPRRVQLSRAEAALTWFQRALALQTDSRDEARRAYQEALRLQPAFVEAHINLGLLHHNTGDLTEAETCYRRALECGPESALAHFNLAVVLEDRADKSGALTAYAEALKRARIFGKPHRIWRACTSNSGVASMPSVIMPPPNVWDVLRMSKQPIAHAEGAIPAPPLWLIAPYFISLLQSSSCPSRFVPIVASLSVVR